MRILLIDDDVAVMENLTLFFRNEFHTVESLSFVEGEQTLWEMLERFAPEAVVLDYGMECPGTQIFRWIRKWKPTASIVFYTNYARSQEQTDMLEVGALESQIIEKREVGLDFDAILDALRSQI